jgi:hypothetical protein
VRAEPAGEAKDKPSVVHKTVHIVVAVVVVVVVPVVLVTVLVGKFTADALVLGLLFGVIGSMVGGTRRMTYLAVPFGSQLGLERLPLMAGGGSGCSAS